MTRITLLKTLSIAAGAVCVASAMPNSAQAGTIGFDDLSPVYLITDVSNGYRGFNWNLLYADASSAALQGTGLERGVVSPNIVAFPAAQQNGASISRSTPFTFNSIYLTAQNSSGLVDILVQGFQGSTIRFSQRINTFVDPAAAIRLQSPSLFTFDWDGIDQLRFVGAGVGMDDFTFSEPTTTTAVPTPALLPSLIAMGGALWRKRKAKALAEASESV
jgi:hypothetical protein